MTMRPRCERSQIGIFGPYNIQEPEAAIAKAIRPMN